MYLAALDTDDLHCSGSRKYDKAFQYSVTKRAQVILTELWAQRLTKLGIAVDVNSMHPGWADTEGVRSAIPEFREKQGGNMRTPDEGADTIVYLAAAPRVKGTSGKFFFDREPVKTHMALARTRSSDKDREWLWAECERLTDWVLPTTALAAGAEGAPAPGASAGAGAGAGASAGAGTAGTATPAAESGGAASTDAAPEHIPTNRV